MNPMNPYSAQLQVSDEAGAPASASEPGPVMPLPALPVRVAAVPPAPAPATAPADTAADRPRARVEMRRATPTSAGPATGAIAVFSPTTPTPVSPIAAVLAWLPSATTALALTKDDKTFVPITAAKAPSALEPRVVAPAEPAVVAAAAPAEPRVTPEPAAAAPAPTASAPTAPAPAAPGTWLPQTTVGYVPTQRRGQASAPLRAPAGPSRRAVVALVAAFLGLAPLAVVLGHLELRGSRRSTRTSRDLSLVALALGYVGLAGWLVLGAALAGLPLAAGLLPSALTGLLGL